MYNIYRESEYSDSKKNNKKRFTEKLNKFGERNKHGVAQLHLMEEERHEKDRIITKMTVGFIDEIYDALYYELDEQNILLPNETVHAINQFLYLINCNYFEQITPNPEKFDREDLINHLLTQIGAYFLQTNEATFNEKIAKNILKRDFLFSDDLTEEIYKEFKKSKSIRGHITKRYHEVPLYQIKRNDVGPTIEEYQAQKDLETGNKDMHFDINNGNHYYEIIDQVERGAKCLKREFGDPSGLDWDIDFLRNIITTIVRDHRQELRKTIPDYQNIQLVTHFVYYAMAYAVINHKDQVHQEELINTFKQWNYLPFDMTLQVVDTIYEENNLDPATHPFRTQPKPKEIPRQKVLKFPGTLQNKSI